MKRYKDKAPETFEFIGNIATDELYVHYNTVMNWAKNVIKCPVFLVLGLSTRRTDGTFKFEEDKRPRYMAAISKKNADRLMKKYREKKAQKVAG